MQIITPTRDEAEAGLRAMKGVLLRDGIIGPVEARLLAAAQRFILGTDFEVDALAPISGEALAAQIERPGLRRQLVGAMVVMSFASGGVGPAQQALVEGYAKALSVEMPELTALRHLAERRLAMLRYDVLRHMYIGEAIGEIWQSRGVRGLLETVAGFRGLRTDAEVAKRYVALGALAEGTLGRTLHDHYRRNGFPFPGERYGAPEVMVLHDLAHVLGGYGTDPGGEFEVAAFTAGFREVQSISILLFVLCQFDLGVKVAPISGADAEVGLLEPERFFAALVRGSRMTVDLFDGWDPWPWMARPLDEVRRAVGVQ